MERSSRTDILNALRHHYPEYAIEAAGLGLLIMSAVANTLLWKHPASPLSAAIADPIGAPCIFRCNYTNIDLTNGRSGSLDRIGKHH